MTDINHLMKYVLCNCDSLLDQRDNQLELLLCEAIRRYFNVDEVPELAKLKGRVETHNLVNEAQKFLIDGVVIFELFAVSNKHVITDKSYTIETAQEYWMIERRL
jgi:hypothetical protein